jgi:creatinine amidohydrolase
MPHSLLMDELSTVQIRQLLNDGWDTVIVPLGATEQHGPALPLCVDNVHGVETALRAARLLGKTLVGPVVPWGDSREHVRFAGTVSLSPATLTGILHDIAESHARSGFKLVYFWLGHGGDNPVLQQVLPHLETKWPGCHVTGIRDLAQYVSQTWDKVPPEAGIALSASGSHAGEFETSMMLAAQPALVRMEAAEPGNVAPFETIVETMMNVGIDAVSANGVLGDQRPANAERGQFYLDTLARYLAADLGTIRTRIDEGRSA